ncbi:TetR/AcrR family transcriptional regulator [Actinocrispum wychmicini]|uniref:TetR family transcriptional regulator n=1 Tax=Actinocrispum wychmicini TaxID=1213861 RepID=A0A4R2J363_9PSEU|nr:TetR/AcrR family transcriptional regulator [Actinocrispum wychmicini]TCO49765.1 TetR family transcriptional regulator [Actinocrispum wychmicini]
MSRSLSRRERYSQATKTALLAAATRRFADLGFAGTSLEDVAADIQATRGAVYHHFASKTALFEAVFQQLETAAMERAVAAAAGAPDPWLAALAALNVFLDSCCDPVYGKIVWQEAPIALGWHHWRESEEEFSFGLVEQLLGAMMDSGIMDRQPLRVTTRIVFAILGAAGVALADAPEPDKHQVKAEYTEVIRRMLVGLRPASATTAQAAS